MVSTGNEKNRFEDLPVVFRYTRREALEDGVLIDLSEWAQETGFVISVACTHAVWHGYVVPPSGTRALGQSERGRARDLLWMLYLAIRRHRDSGDPLLFEVIFLQAPRRQETVQLKALIGPGDEGEPVLTILLPEED